MNRNNAFYNTPGLQGELLAKATNAALSQEDKIREFFSAMSESLFSPFDILKYCFTPATPITSVRRAMTNLTNDGFLVKTDVQRQGPYGVPTHLWKKAG